MLSAVVEQDHDDHGIVWPVTLTPYQVHILVMSIKDSEQMVIAEALYDQLTKLGIEALLDDRDDRAGVKFKDSNLIGIPVTIVVGKEAGQGRVGYVERSTSAKEAMAIAGAVARATHYIAAGGEGQESSRGC